MIQVFYILRLIARGLRYRPWGSLLTLVACWFALCQLSVVLYVVDAADTLSSMPAASASLVAYLKDATPGDGVAGLHKKLSSMKEVSKVLFVPRQQGLEKMKRWLGQDSPLVEGVDPQILPDAFEITLKRDHAGQVADLAQSVGRLSGIDNVRYRRGLVGYIAGSMDKILVCASVLGGVVVICLALLIFLSIRVGIVSRKQQIEVMGMLGASYLFIYAPYLIEAGMYGLLGALAALMTTSAGIGYLHDHVSSLQGFIRPMDAYQAAGLLFFACFCSMTGALLAIKRSINA